MEMTGRSVGSDYEYGFNGKMDDKWNGNSGAYSDFGDRMYDNRLGRWMSTDRQASRGANISSYAYCTNKPILYGDPDGQWKDIKITRYFNGRDGKPRVKNWYNIFQKTVKKEIEIIIHDAKLYVHSGTVVHHTPDPESEYNVPNKKNVPISKSDAENAAYLLEQDIVCEFGDVTVNSEDGREIHLATKFAEPIEIIEDLSDANYNDDVIIIVEDINDNFSMVKDPTGLTINEKIMALNVGVLNFQWAHEGSTNNGGELYGVQYSTTSAQIYIHEVGHQLIGDGKHKFLNNDDRQSEMQFDFLNKIRRFKLKIFSPEGIGEYKKMQQESKTKSRRKMEDQKPVPTKDGR